MAKGELILGGNADDLIRELHKAYAEIHTLSQGAAKVGQQMDSWRSGAGRLATQIGAIAGGYIGLRSTVSGILDLSEKWEQSMRRVGKEAQVTARELAALAMQQEPGTGRQRAAEAMAAGARFGVERAQAVDIAATMQAQRAGDWQTGIAAAVEVFKLSGWAAVPPEKAKGAVVMGLGAGLPAGLAARLPYAAGEVSALTPAELADVAPAMAFYQGLKGGAAGAYEVGAILSRTVPAGELETYTRAFGRAMTTREGTWGKFVGGLPGAAEGDFYKMLSEMRKEKIGTTQQLERLGLGEVRQQKALMDMLTAGPEAEEMGQRVRELAALPDLLERKRGGAERGFPELAFERVAREAQERFRGEKGLPTTPEAKAFLTAAQGLELRERARAEAAVKVGLEAFIQLPEEGRLTSGRAKIGLPWLGAKMAAGARFGIDLEDIARDIETRMRWSLEHPGEAVPQELLRQPTRIVPGRAAEPSEAILERLNRERAGAGLRPFGGAVWGAEALRPAAEEPAVRTPPPWWQAIELGELLRRQGRGGRGGDLPLRFELEPQTAEQHQRRTGAQAGGQEAGDERVGWSGPANVPGSGTLGAAVGADGAVPVRVIETVPARVIRDEARPVNAVPGREFE